MNGTITNAKRDESEKGIVELEQGVFHRWLVTINANGQDIQTDILRKPESPDPTGESVEQKPNGRWKVGQPQNGGAPRGRSPADTKAIQRQHSQEMGIRATALEFQMGTFKTEQAGDVAVRIKKWTDFFEKDIAS